MKHQHLHDFAKFGAGLVLGDFLCGLWFYVYGLFPIHFLGVNLTSDMAIPWMIFDAVLFAILIHYGWHLGKTPVIKSRSYLLCVGTLLSLVALAHLIRIFFGADIDIAGWMVPLWLSWIGVAVTSYLSYMSFRLAMSSK